MTRRVLAVVLLLCPGVLTPAPALERLLAGSANSTPVNVSGTATDSLTPVVATSGPFVHVAWIESESTTDGLRATIWYVRSLDGGESFETPRPIAPLTGYASALQCAVEGSTVHLVWLATSYTTGSPAAVDYQRSSDGGASFEPFVAINGEAPPGAATLVVKDGRAAAVWQADGRIWMARSIDDGLSFESDQIQGTDVVASVMTVRATASRDRILLAWIETDSGVGKLGVGRVDWQSGLLDASTPLEAVGASDAAVASSGDFVVAAWTTTGSDRFARAARSTDGGSTFGAPLTLGDAGVLGSPKAAASTDRAFVAWVDSHGRLRVGRIEPDGSASDIRIRPNKGAVFPELVEYGGAALVAWRSGSGAASVLRQCTVGAVALGSKGHVVSRRGRLAVAPRLAASGSSSIIVWQQPVDGVADVFARRLAS